MLNQHPKRNIREGWRQEIDEHPQGCLSRLNKSGCSFIMLEKETVTRVNSLRCPTSGEKRLAIKTRRTETKNFLEFPSSMMTSCSAMSICTRLRQAQKGVYQARHSACGIGGLRASGTCFFPSLSSGSFHLPLSCAPQYERNEHFAGRS